MCSNYRPVTRQDRLLTFFGVERDRDEVPTDVFPTGLAPFIRLAQEPGEEKRMVIILAPSDYDDWLTCSVAEAPRYFRQWLGPLVIEAAPLARAPRAISGKLIQPPAPRKVDPETGELF